MQDQKHKFILDPDISYLNCAYLAPMLKSAKKAVERRLIDFENPSNFTSSDWFDPVNKLRSLYAQLINVGDPDRIAITPSCSYGIANAAAQVRPKRGSNIVVTEAQFPSNYYSWKRICDKYDCEIRTVSAPQETIGRGRDWNDLILDAIDTDTAVVAIPPLHHSDGTLFDLKSIREKSSLKNSLLIIDGTQSVGALPFDVSEIRPDALICAGYKWLLGPYGSGMAYYGDFFDEGVPIEENWIAHEGAGDFENLSIYKDGLAPKGLRYSSGEHAAMIHMPVQIEGAKQILEWGPKNITAYANDLFAGVRSNFENLGCIFEEDRFRAAHLFGMRFDHDVDIAALKRKLAENKIYVSARIGGLRVSVHLFNTENDFAKLLDCVAGFVGETDLKRSSSSA